MNDLSVLILACAVIVFIVWFISWLIAPWSWSLDAEWRMGNHKKQDDAP